MHAPALQHDISDEALWRDLDNVPDSELTLEDRTDDEVIPHLVWAGFDLKRARVVANGRVVSGWLHTPDLDLGVIGFTPHQLTPSPPLGEQVRVAYGRGPDSYVFEADLLDEDEGTWLFSLPTAIGARGQRLTGRTLACGAWFLQVDGDDGGEGDEIELHDLSVAGIGMLAAPDEIPLRTGTRLTGYLVRVDGFSVPVEVVVKHTTPLADHPDWQVTGGTIRFADETDRSALAGILTE